MPGHLAQYGTILRFLFDGCAFAHDVEEALGPGGNVDHVAFTPAGVWVVETKTAWLGESRFKEALRQVWGKCAAGSPRGWQRRCQFAERW